MQPIHRFLSALCFGCQKPLKTRQAFCHACARFLLEAPAAPGEPRCLFPHEGPGKEFIAAMRGLAPYRTAAWALALAKRKKYFEGWGGVEVVLSAPQNPRRDISGLVRFAELAAKKLEVLHVPKAFRKRPGHTQHGKSLSARMNTECFVELACAPELVAGKQVLVIDDVYTSGTTLDLCCYVLNKAGAEDVIRFALARQVMPSFERKKEEAN